VGVLERFGNQLFDAHFQGLGGRVAEYLRGRRVPEDYALSLCVSDDHTVSDPVEEPAET
jgi:hypothetical protein